MSQLPLISSPIELQRWKSLLDPVLAENPSVPVLVSSQLSVRVTTSPNSTGQYRCYQKVAASATGVDQGPSTSPSTQDGMRIFAVAYAAAGTPGSTNRWEVFVGKGKNVEFKFYQSQNRSGALSQDVFYFGTTVLIGLYKGYDPLLGVAYVDAIQQASSVTTRLVGEALLPAGAAVTDATNCYFDVLIRD